MKRTVLPALVLAVAVLCAYHGSFRGAFVFDDGLRIVENPRIRRVWPPWDAMTATSRPLVQLSFAANYAAGGLDPRGYHAVNLAVHVLATLVLFAFLRGTLVRPAFPASVRDAAPGLAFASALLWGVHPLGTQAVTYVVQRSEALVSLCYLLVLYAFVRGVEAPRPGRWWVLAIASAALGAGCKAVIVSAPLLVALYDRVFVARSLREMLARRRTLYLGLATVWPLAALVLARGSDDWSRSAGLSFGRVGLGQYAAAQPAVVLHYLRLVLWPDPLVLDYAWPVPNGPGDVAPALLAIAGLLAATVWALRRAPGVGFFAAWFFLVLLPSSSVVPIADLAFEHRVYLALAGPVVLVVLGAHAVLGRLGRRAGAVEVAVLIAVAATLGALTARRNLDYASPHAIWADTVAKRPANARAHQNLAVVLDDEGRLADAVAGYEAAIRLRPEYADALSSLGWALYRQGDAERAVGYYRAALAAEPWHAGAHANLGVALADRGRTAEAIAEFTEALRVSPGSPQAHYNLG
ncbi:MAG TPA: tetratricopeptide repeat protein, partial [Candidatus Binatia bacterium]|nr:tetratricopeptide repeat protein [Candidatus Binatia bacterium]